MRPLTNYYKTCDGVLNTAACFGDHITETLRKSLPNVISVTSVVVICINSATKKMEYACKIIHQMIDFMRYFTYKGIFALID